MSKNDVRRNIIYTSKILETIYNLKTQDVENCENGRSYAGAEVVIEESYPFIVGLYNKKKQYHILNADEIILLDILLSWDALVNEDNQEFITILFEDIDWMRNRRKRNQEHVNQTHCKYLQTLQSLENLYLIYGNEDVVKTDADLEEYPLVNVEHMIKENTIVGIKYNLGKMGKILKAQQQMVSIDMNIFKYSSTEFMKYKILRYLIVAIYMNRTKKNEFSRSYKSILKSIPYEYDDAVISYFDFILNSPHTTKYLSRCTARFTEIMNELIECDFIRNYSILPDKDRTGLLTASGKIQIKTNLFHRKRKHYTS